MIPRRLRRRKPEARTKYVLEFQQPVSAERAAEVLEHFERQLSSRSPVMGVAGATVKEIHVHA